MKLHDGLTSIIHLIGALIFSSLEASWSLTLKANTLDVKSTLPNTTSVKALPVAPPTVLQTILQSQRNATSSSQHLRGPAVPQTNSNTSSTVGGPNYKVWEPWSGKPEGSLILIMGRKGDLKWTMTQWWYLAAQWASKDQEWCSSSCQFDQADQDTVWHLRNSFRVVDAVGKIPVKTGGSTWYNYANWDTGEPVQHEYEMAVADIFQLIQQEYAIHGDYKKIAIAGMSQGGDLALEVGIRFPHELGMVISQRGILSPKRQSGDLSLAAYSGTPFILTAGDSDEYWSLQTFLHTCSACQNIHPVFFKLYQGLGHGTFHKEEWRLLMNAFWLMYEPGSKKEHISGLEWWNTCQGAL